MSFRKWILVFVTFSIVISLIVGGFNMVSDPFGVYGDRFFNWYNYNMTNNPRVSKIAFMDKHQNEFDSYIVGCSKTSSISTEKLNKYYNGAKFYNMIMYGGDMYDIEKTVFYLVDNFKVKNIVVNIGLEEGANYNKSKDNAKDRLHAKVTDSSLIEFYAKYFFMNPEYSFDKIKKYLGKSYLPNANSVFDSKTGAYNKIVRDRESIGNIDEFLENNKVFKKNVNPNDKKIELKAMDQSVAAIKRIKEHCEAKGSTFMLMTSPVFHKEVQTYDAKQLKEYWQKIASVTDFWDFSGYNSVSYEPRYFYDFFHFRNSVGDMALAYIFNDKSVYVPMDFGHKTTKENVSAHTARIFNDSNKSQHEKTYSVDIPILMYHHISKNVKDKSTTVTPEGFKEHLKALKERGYSTIFCEDLIEYVNQGIELPKNPILITFDDGYTSVYQYAYPALKELEMKATVSIIGISVGKNKYKNTDIEIIPHFDYNNAKEMYLSGVMDIQSHSFNMHDNLTIDKNGREDALKLKGENESQYITFFKKDYIKLKEEMQKNIGNEVYAYFYPHGKASLLSEVLLKELGNQISVTTDPGINTVIKGLPQSLYSLKRINVRDDLSGKELITRIESYKK